MTASLSDPRAFLLILDQGGQLPPGISPDDLVLSWRTGSEEEVQWLLLEVLNRAPVTPHQDKLLALAFRALAARTWEVETGSDLPEWFLELTDALHRQLGPECPSRAQLLQIISRNGNRSLATLVDMLVADPPESAEEVVLILAPLFQREDYDPDYLFPRLLDAVEHPALAASIVDLTNMLVRNHRVEEHPGRQRSEDFCRLLGELAQTLMTLEETVGAEQQTAEDGARIAQRVDDSVSLVVALCDALALMSCEAAVGKLFQVLQLRHRRIRVEAAAALARLGQDEGRESLLELAAEPVTRLRVLAYADELGLLEEVNEEFQTEVARGEAELASWLASPTQFGIPPTEIELVDQSTLYWPGYDEEVACLLFRFTYRFEQGEFSNIGIVGPLVHVFTADLADLPVSDIYAAFAGWQAEHEEIYEIDVRQLDEFGRLDVSRFERRLHDEGYEEIEPLRLGFFFGDKAMISRATREGVAGIAVIDARETHWRPGSHERALGPSDCFFIYKGRMLLRSFNP